ncbi:MAG: sulfotransferase domain-containing protein [Caldilineaceae bacterium]
MVKRNLTVLQVGYAKSGNLWLYRILEHILDGQAIPRRSFIQNHSIYSTALARPTHFIGQASVDTLEIRPEGCFCKVANGDESLPIDNITAYLRQCRHVWSHSPFCQRTLDVLPRVDKVVYIVRDGRDQAISLSHFAFLPARLAVKPNNLVGHADPQAFLNANFETNLGNWVRHVGGYLQHRRQINLHFIFYERLRYDFDKEIDALLTYLEFDLNRQSRAALQQAVDFATMQQVEGGHVRKGEVGEWRTILTPEQKAHTLAIAGPMLRLLNYPVDERTTTSMYTLPMLPTDLHVRQIVEAMEPALPRLSMVARSKSRLKRLYQRFWT